MKQVILNSEYAWTCTWISSWRWCEMLFINLQSVYTSWPLTNTYAFYQKLDISFVGPWISFLNFSFSFPLTLISVQVSLRRSTQVPWHWNKLIQCSPAFPPLNIFCFRRNLRTVFVGHLHLASSIHFLEWNIFCICHINGSFLHHTIPFRNL